MTSEHWDERYRQPELLWTAEPNRFLVSELDGASPGRALDVASGEGRNAVWLARQGWEVTGVDFSAAGVEKSRRLAAEHDVEVDWVVADVTRWPLPAEAYDLVIIFYLHLPAPEMRAVFERAVTAVAAAGALLVVGHAMRNLAEGYGGPPTADRLYRLEDVVAQLDGLTVEHAGEVERPVAVDGATRVAIDILLRARRA